MSNYHFSVASGNAKTGPIPVTTSSASTCPATCPLKSNGCYAEYGPLSWHWKAVTAGERGTDLGGVCHEVSMLPKGQLWRWAQAGDLPGDGRFIDRPALQQLTQANKGRRGFTFTHYDPALKRNAAAIADANAAGFTVNLSANNLAHAERLHALGIAPVVVVLPQDVAKPFVSPGGLHVSVCPATVNERMTCAQCGICATQHKAIIGFPSHGSGKGKAEALSREHKVTFVRRAVAVP